MYIHIYGPPNDLPRNILYGNYHFILCVHVCVYYSTICFHQKLAIPFKILRNAINIGIEVDFDDRKLVARAHFGAPKVFVLSNNFGNFHCPVCPV